MNGIVNGKEVKSLSDIPITSESDVKQFTVTKGTWTNIPNCAFVLCGVMGAEWSNLIFVNANYAMIGGTQYIIYQQTPAFAFPDTNNILNLYHYSNSTGQNTLRYNVSTKQIYWWYQGNAGLDIYTDTFYYW